MPIKYTFLLLILIGGLDTVSMDYRVSTAEKYQLNKSILEDKRVKIQKKLAHDLEKDNSDLSNQLAQTTLELEALEFRELTQYQLPRNQATIQKMKTFINNANFISANILDPTDKITSYKKVLTAQLNSTLLFEQLRNNQAISQELIDSCNMEAEDEQHNTLLHYAAIYQNPAAVKIILDAIQIPDTLIDQEFESFMQQLQIQDNNAEQLFQNNIINRKNNKGETPYQIAKKYNNIQIMQLLKNNGAEIPVEEIKQDNHSSKPYKSKKKKKKNYYKKNTQPNESAPATENMPVSEEKLRELMEQMNGAPNIFEKIRITHRLMSALPDNVLQLLNYITSKKIKQFTKSLNNIEDLSPMCAIYLLKEACFYNDTNSATLLLNKGINLKGISCVPMLTDPIMNGNEKLVQLLIDHGADVKHKDGYKNTPLHHVVFWYARKHIDHNCAKNMISLFLNNGADTTIKNTDGLNAFFGKESV